jgi:hypothetical protein
VSGKAPQNFAERVDRLKLPSELRAVIEPLLEQLDLLSGEIEGHNEHLEKMVKDLPEVAHLREIPGVGPVVATYFVLTIDDPDRFKRSRDVAAFFGLRPSMRGSASMTHFGRIAKEGDREMRRLLVQAAHACLLTTADSELKRWALALAERRRKGKAVVVLARKLAVLMHRLSVTGEVYQAFTNTEAFRKRSSGPGSPRSIRKRSSLAVCESLPPHRLRRRSPRPVPGAEGRDTVSLARGGGRCAQRVGQIRASDLYFRADDESLDGRLSALLRRGP